MKIRLSVGVALVSSLHLFACSGGAEGGDPMPSSDEPSPIAEQPAPAAAAEPQGRAKHRIAPSTHLSGGPSLGGMHAFDGDGGAPTTISTNKTTYAYCERITVSFENMPGNANDWIDFAPAGSEFTVFSWDAYTNSLGPTNSTTTLEGDCLPPGNYVARAFPSDSYNRIAESVAFTVGDKPATTATVELNKTAMNGFEKVTATITNAPANKSVFVTASKPHQSTDTIYFGKNVQTDANGSATVDIGNVVAGEFEIRVFDGNDWKGTSPKINVSAAVTATYSGGSSVLVKYAAMQALNTQDRIVLAKWDGNAFVNGPEVTADWWWSGQETFSGLTSGDYIARVYFAFPGTPGTPDAVSEQFTVTAQ